MPFEKGNQHGAKSKRGKSVLKHQAKQYLANFIEDYLNGDFQDDFNKLQARDKIKVVSEFMPYVMPKMNANDINVNSEGLAIQLVHKDADSKK